jgi:hypothetical protein
MPWELGSAVPKDSRHSLLSLKQWLICTTTRNVVDGSFKVYLAGNVEPIIGGSIRYDLMRSKFLERYGS